MCSEEKRPKNGRRWTGRAEHENFSIFRMVQVVVIIVASAVQAVLVAWKREIGQMAAAASDASCRRPSRPSAGSWIHHTFATVATSTSVTAAAANAGAIATLLHTNARPSTSSFLMMMKLYVAKLLLLLGRIE